MHKPKLLDRVRAVARVRHLSLRTEQAYSDCIRRFILYHKKRHPEEMGTEEIQLFLSHLAVEGQVSASTQNVALCALLFLYRDVLQVELPFVEGIQRAKRPTRVPVVFTRREVEKLLALLSGSYGLIVRLLYGSGLRLMEAARQRVVGIVVEVIHVAVEKFGRLSSNLGVSDEDDLGAAVREISSFGWYQIRGGLHNQSLTNSTAATGTSVPRVMNDDSPFPNWNFVLLNFSETRINSAAGCIGIQHVQQSRAFDAGKKHVIGFRLAFDI
jgi:site-specific recombinase XerC